MSAAAGVAVLLDLHWDALDYDFRHELGLDLGDCCWGPEPFGVRRLISHIGQLPQETSRVAREMGWSWDEMREMTATLVELAANARRTKKSDPVYRYPRPSGLTTRARARQHRPETQSLTREGVRAALMGPLGGE